MENDLESIKRRQDLLEAYVNALEFRLDVVADRIGLVNAGVGTTRSDAHRRRKIARHRGDHSRRRLRCRRRALARPALAHAVPIAVGVVVLIAGALQFTAWKARHLACCRMVPGHGRPLPADAGTAWRHGLRLGLHCSTCCAGLTTILLVIGVMDLRAMAVVAAAITVERLAPAGEHVARAVGAVIVVAGLFLIARAAGLAW